MAQPIGDELLQQKLVAFQGPFPKVFFPSEELVGSGLTSPSQAQAENLSLPPTLFHSSHSRAAKTHPTSKRKSDGVGLHIW